MTRREHILVQLDDDQTAEFVPSLIAPVDTIEYQEEFQELENY